MIKVKKIGKGVKYEDAIRLEFKYNLYYLDKIKELEQKHYVIVDEEWEIPVSELSNLIDKLGAEEFDLEYNPKIVLNEDKKVIETRERLKGIKPLMEFNFKTEPFPHQIEGFNYGISKANLLLADEQGLGKTKMAIDVAVARKLKGNKKCLIVCGVNSVKYNWQKEIKIHSSEDSIVIDARTLAKKVAKLKEWLDGAEYFGIINIEALRKKEILDLIRDAIRYVLIQLVIVDEIHKAKNGESQQGISLLNLTSKFKIGLTGTPLMNKCEELHNILTWLGAERRNFWAYRKSYCIMGGYMDKKVIGYKNKEDLHERLSRVMLRRKKDEVLNLPPKIHTIEYIEMTSRQKKLYDEIRLGIISELDDIVFNPNPLTSLLRLRQVTGGILGEDNPKLDRLKELLEEIVASGRKAVIFSQWKTQTKLLKEALAEYNLMYIDGDVDVAERQKQVDKFQNDEECKIAIGTIGAMGTGLTLTAGSYVIFLDKAWTPADNEQAEDRCHRIGTTETVNVISLICKDTIDEKIENILADKKELFEQIVEGKLENNKTKRAILENLLGL